MKPFVYKFETSKNKYIYDINSNRVFQVNNVVYELIYDYTEHSFNEILKRYSQYTKEQLLEGWNEIDHAVKQDGLFSTHRPSRIAYWNNMSIEDTIKSSPHEQLILNVTERCNLRCSYCVYSGKYKGKRIHCERNMSFDTAKSALDKFFLNTGDKVYISFYGGEPLLEFELIKKIVEYTEHYYKKSIYWSMTTNGTLLTFSVRDFLYKNKFDVTVSLDGPKDIHDRYRKLRNGEGSFDIVMENLRQFQSLDKEYFCKNVGFSAVSAPPFNLALINNFFTSEPLVSNNRISLSYIGSNIDGFEYSPTLEGYETLKRDNIELSRQYVNSSIVGGINSNFIEGIFMKDFVRLYNRSKTPLGDSIYPNGCCVPGSRKVFVSTDGKLHVCEKMDDCYEIGTVENWKNTSQIKILFDEYLELSTNCYECWACRLCTSCFANFIMNSKLDKNKHKAECKRIRNSLERTFINYYTILEENPFAFDNYNDIKFT